MTQPPLPAGMDSWAIQKKDGSETQAVSIRDAGKLIGRRATLVEQWIRKGQVEICLHPTEGKLVLVDSLWAALPEDVRS